MFKSIGDILDGFEKGHGLEGAPTSEELAANLPNVIPPTLEGYIIGHKVDGNVLTLLMANQISGQDMSMHAPEICKQLNARIGRNAVARVKIKAQPLKKAGKPS